MKSIFILLFFVASGSVFASNRPHCDGMLYVDARPADSKRCSKVKTPEGTMYCCQEGGSTGYYVNGTYYYDTRNSRADHWTRPAPQCRTVVTCYQYGPYGQACSPQRFCD